MKLRRIVCIVIFFGVLARFGPAHADGSFPGAEWERVALAESGWSEAGLAQARTFSDQIRSSAVMIVQHGKVVAEWGNTTKPMELASIRKSLLSALVGIAVSEHLINLDSTLGELGIDDTPPSLTEVEKGATVRQLLQARSGVYHHALYETPGMAKARPPRYSHAPGTFWYYNNWDFNALGTIYERATGTGIFDALNQQDRQADRHAGLPAAGRQLLARRGFDSPCLSDPHECTGSGAICASLSAAKAIGPDDRSCRSSGCKRARMPIRDRRGVRATAISGGLTFSTAPSRLRSLCPRAASWPQGAGGQYALVVPALDLVVVHRVDRDTAIPEPSARSIARLFWLLLKAEGYDPGPDASLAAATGERPKGAGPHCNIPRQDNQLRRQAEGRALHHPVRAWTAG